MKKRESLYEKKRDIAPVRFGFPKNDEFESGRPRIFTVVFGDSPSKWNVYDTPDLAYAGLQKFLKGKKK